MGSLWDEEAEHRRSRLWIGYSEDDLHDAERRQAEEGQAASGQEPRQDTRNGPSAVPIDYDNLDEIAAPSPVENSLEGRKQGYLEDRKYASSTQNTGVPDDYDNLDEIAAPSPVDETQQNRLQGYLEDRNGNPPVRHKSVRRRTEDGKEKTGPSIIKETQQRRQNGDPDAHTHGSPSSGEDGVMKKYSGRRTDASKLATQLYTISYLIFFSILGTLARLGLQALTFYPGAPVQTGLLWANVGGSLIMGFLSEDQKLFRTEQDIPIPRRSRDLEKGKRHQRGGSAKAKHAAEKRTLPLYIGLATGFCGSFTSFSSFMRDAFFALSNALPVPIQHPSSAPISQTINVHRNPGYSFLALLAVLIVTIGLSLMALLFGAHLALFLEPYTPSIPFLFGRRIVDRFVVFLAGGCWLAAIFMAIWPPDRPSGPVGNTSWAQETWRSQALFALVFAPLGCVLRFYASLHFNGRIKSFPLGTFSVNIFGTAMDAMFVDLQRAPVGGMVGCQVLQGMADGFCGCLTTVSTWVVELTALRLQHAYFYGSASVAVALSLFVIITGSLQWTQGFVHPLCMS